MESLTAQFQVTRKLSCSSELGETGRNGRKPPNFPNKQVAIGTIVKLSQSLSFIPFNP
jgi:hypothetical protein